MTRIERQRRVHKRVVLRFSNQMSGELVRSGCTMDLSLGGLFLSVGVPLAPGTHIQGKLELPDGRSARLHGVVTWARQVPRALNALARGGMGLRLLWAESTYYEFVGGALTR